MAETVPADTDAVGFRMVIPAEFCAKFCKSVRGFRSAGVAVMWDFEHSNRAVLVGQVGVNSVDGVA